MQNLARSLRRRIVLIVVFALVYGVLVVSSTPRLVGDGAEYVAMSLGLIESGSPSFAPAELEVLDRRLESLGARLPPDVTHRGRGERFYLRHFWLYSAFAVPTVSAAVALGAHPALGFAVLNLLLLLAAVWVVSERVRPAGVVLLFLSPIVWWIDKAHTEVFVFSLLAIAFASLDRRPHWSMLAIGLAATEYLVLAGLIPLTAVFLTIDRPRLLRDRRFWSAAVVGAALALWHVAYYLLAIGVISAHVHWGGDPMVPGVREWGAVIWDLNVGLLVSSPLLVAAVIGTLAVLAARARSRLRSPQLFVSAATLVLLPVAFAQTANLNHGGTPGMSRFALWLIPLVIPLLQQIGSEPGAMKALWGLALASAVWCAWYFHPQRPETYRYPTRAALFVWTRVPAASRPMPEIFSERMSHREPGQIPVSTERCEKVLIVAGRWPAPCPPAPDLPRECDEPGALCYANRTSAESGEFRFTPAPRAVGYDFQANPRAWPAGTQSKIGELLRDLRWWEMQTLPMASRNSMLRAANRVAWTSRWQGAGRLFVFVAGAEPGASLSLRVPGSFSGRFVDPHSGSWIEGVQSPVESGELWNLSVPAGPASVVLILDAGPREVP